MAETKSMRRALAILKYLPAVLCGVLIVAWVVSVFAQFGVAIRQSQKVGETIGSSVSCFRGSIRLSRYSGPDVECSARIGKSGFYFDDYAIGLDEIANEFPWHGTLLLDDRTSDLETDFRLWMPIPFLLTLAVPVSVALLTRFRFPLWSYFAWTALIAAELAHYLR